MNKPPEFLKVWIYLLARANFSESNNLKRGQGFTSIAEIIDMLSYNVGYRKVVPTRKQVWGIIDWFRNTHNINTDVNNEGNNEGNSEGTTKVPMMVTTKVTHGFVYSICKYDVYQDCENYEGNNEGNNEGTAKVTTKVPMKGDNKYKNSKELINNKENTKESSSVFSSGNDEMDVALNLMSPDLKQVMIEFITFRKTKKSPMTPHALDLLIKKLNTMTNSEQGKIDILNQSIMNGWTGIFELKGSQLGFNQTQDPYAKYGG